MAKPKGQCAPLLKGLANAILRLRALLQPRARTDRVAERVGDKMRCSLHDAIVSLPPIGTPQERGLWSHTSDSGVGRRMFALKRDGDGRCESPTTRLGFEQ